MGMFELLFSKHRHLERVSHKLKTLSIREWVERIASIRFSQPKRRQLVYVVYNICCIYYHKYFYKPLRQ